VRKRRRFRFWVLHPMRTSSLRDGIRKGALRDFKTGTGFAGAKLSEIRSSRR
jgi:hypothetical protein